MKNDLSKRKWRSLLHAESLKWYTGYEHDTYVDDKELGLYRRYKCVISKEHYTDTLTVKLAGYGRGRSAANFYVEDQEGHKYMMSMSGFFELMDLLLKSQTVAHKGGYFTATFVQTKQGANYFIAPYKED